MGRQVNTRQGAMPSFSWKSHPGTRDAAAPYQIGTRTGAGSEALSEEGAGLQDAHSHSPRDKTIFERKFDCNRSRILASPPGPGND